VRNDLAHGGHAAGAQKHEAAQRVDIVIFIFVMQVHADGCLERGKGRCGLHQIDAGLFLFPEQAFVFVVFILDLADHGFDQVLDRDKAVNPAIFVDHKGHVDTFFLHLLQQGSHRHRGCREHDGTQQFAQRKPAGAAKALLQRQILEQHKALRMVHRPLVDRQARIAAFAKLRDKILQPDGQRYGLDLGIGGGNVVHAHAAEVQKMRCIRGRGGRGGRGHIHQIAGGGRGEGVQKTPDQPALRRFASVFWVAVRKCG
jgi:hypothetical protein